MFSSSWYLKGYASKKHVIRIKEYIRSKIPVVPHKAVAEVLKIGNL